MKTKTTLMTVLATVLLTGAAVAANAQRGYGFRHGFIPAPRVAFVGPRVFIPAPHVFIPPVPVPAVGVGVYGGYGYGYGYGHPVYRERFVAPVYERRGWGRRRW